MPSNHGQLEVLDDEECRRLLSGSSIGRLGFSDGAMPAIVPVPFAVCGDIVVIPVACDSLLRKTLRGAVVALEVDSYRDESGAGWSVTAVGPSRVISRPADVAEIDGLGLFPGPARLRSCYIAVQLGLLRGWRMDPAARSQPPADSSVDETVAPF